MSCLRGMLVITVCGLLGACGQKGALIMPDAPRSAVPAATPAPAAAPAPATAPGGEATQERQDETTPRR